MDAAKGLENSDELRQSCEESILIDSRNTSMQRVITQNTRQPISRLPYEMLSAIFRILASIEPPKFTSLGWIKATHVCRRWREVACADGTLWSNVSDDLGEEWTKTMMQRAQSTPVSLRLMSCRSCSYVIPLLAQHLRHIEKLNLSFTTGMTNQILQLLATDLQQVKDIRFGTTSPRCNNTSCFRDHALSPITFSANTQALRRLSLSDIFVDFSQQLPRHLEHLELIGPPLSMISIPQLSALLLASSASLVTLRLSNCLPDSELSLIACKTVFLPRLQQLHLVDKQLGCSVLIPSLRPPDLCKVSIMCDGYDEDLDADKSSSIACISDLLQRAPAFPKLVKLEIGIQDELQPGALTTKLAGWRVPVADNIYIDPDFSLILEGHIKTEEIRTIFQSSPFRSVSDLSFRSDILLSDWFSGWQDFADLFPNITCFRYACFAAHDADRSLFLNAFSITDAAPRLKPSPYGPLNSTVLQQAHSRHSTYSSPPIFPKLCRLVIDADVVSDSYHNVDTVVDYYDKLRQCLLARRQLGFGIRELHLIMGPSGVDTKGLAEFFWSAVTRVTFEDEY